MTLISHEIPKALYNMHDLINDYPYVLGHLMLENKDYEKFYRKKISEGKFCIFDNGAFELGESIDHDKLQNLILEYSPSHYILPDKVHDYEATITQGKDFLKRSVPGVPIGVLQGKNKAELTKCLYDYLDLRIKYIAIPFDPLPDSDYGVSRYYLFRELWEHHLKNKLGLSIHFLGCKNPSEFLLYSQEYISRIDSVDTSSPIIAGWNGIKYGECGYSKEKPKEKLADNLDIELSSDQIQDIIYNVKKFRQYWHR